ISVTSNVAPRLCAEFQGACLKGDYASALNLQDKLMPLHVALFIETNPSPAKYALSVLGRCADTVRLPMVGLADSTKAAVRAAMVHAGPINYALPFRWRALLARRCAARDCHEQRRGRRS